MCMYVFVLFGVRGGEFRQDAWALRSLDRALDADRRGAFDWEICPLQVGGRGGAVGSAGRLGVRGQAAGQLMGRFKAPGGVELRPLRGPEGS